MKKKIIALALMLVMMCNLTACNSGLFGKMVNKIADSKQEEASKKEAEIAQKVEDGRGYLFGIDGKERDYKKAYDTFAECAKEGNADAKYYLGVMYEKGYHVKQDYSEAKLYYQDADANKHKYAECALGYMYAMGNGINENLTKAKLYFEGSLKNGCVEANAGIAIVAHKKENNTDIHRI